MKHNSSGADQIHEVRRVALVVRVSTDRQAMTEEGSLKNQLQRLRSYMQYRNSCSEEWREIRHIELRAISGKDAVRSQEIQPLYEERARSRVCLNQGVVRYHHTTGPLCGNYSHGHGANGA